MNGKRQSFSQIENYDGSGGPWCLDANSNGYPSNGDNVQLWSCNTHSEQKWLGIDIFPAFGGIKNSRSSYCIDANSKSYPGNGDNVQLWSCNGNDEQLWSSSQ